MDDRNVHSTVDKTVPLPFPSEVQPIINGQVEPLVMDVEPPLPCDCIEKDDEETKEIVMDEEVDEYEHSSIFGNEPLEPWPFPAGPALEVISVAIFKPDQSDSRIYGEITTDYLKEKYYFYKGDKHELELIKPGWNDLVLTQCPIAPVMGGHVKFKLTNNDDDTLIFDEVYDMNKAIKREGNGNSGYDDPFGNMFDMNETVEKSEEGTWFLEGNGNSGYRFEMIFSKTPFAVIASVLMFVKSTSPPPRCGKDYFELRGKITTNKFVCFKTKYNEELRLEYGKKSCVPIRRIKYAVPVDSTLAIEVELYKGNLCIMEKKCEIEASRRSRCPGLPKLYFGGSRHDGFDFGIQVQWTIHEDFFANDLLYMTSFYGAMIIKQYEPLSPGALVEVFSVFSGGSAPRDIDLYGAIVVCDGDEKFNILAGNKDCPGKSLSSSKNDEQQFRTLSLKWPDGKWVVGENFKLYLKLKDVKGNLVCVGEISWRPDGDSRYDCRLCDVFKGDNGYLAAVHYSVFKNGKKAKVSVECSNGPFSIYGSVFAKYNNYVYSSTYDEECYRSILFKRSKEDAMYVKSSQIPLLKSQVSAPSDCDELVVSGDLWVRPFSETCPYKLFHFDTTDGKSCNIGWGSFTVKVVWD